MSRSGRAQAPPLTPTQTQPQTQTRGVCCIRRGKSDFWRKPDSAGTPSPPKSRPGEVSFNPSEMGPELNQIETIHQLHQRVPSSVLSRPGTHFEARTVRGMGGGKTPEKF